LYGGNGRIANSVSWDLLAMDHFAANLVNATQAPKGLMPEFSCRFK
jgi:hypothetical protein